MIDKFISSIINAITVNIFKSFLELINKLRNGIRNNQKAKHKKEVQNVIDNIIENNEYHAQIIDAKELVDKYNMLIKDKAWKNTKGKDRLDILEKYVKYFNYENIEASDKLCSIYNDILNSYQEMLNSHDFMSKRERKRYPELINELKNKQ